MCFDQSEGALEICAGADCMPLESQRLTLGSGDFAVPFAAGWCQLDLDIPSEPISRGALRPPEPPEAAQSWVGATVHGGNVVAGGLNAVVIAHACDETDPALPITVFADGFESGDTSGWTNVLP